MDHISKVVTTTYKLSTQELKEVFAEKLNVPAEDLSIHYDTETDYDYSDHFGGHSSTYVSGITITHTSK